MDKLTSDMDFMAEKNRPKPMNESGRGCATDWE
jgi:hypothetical protein